MRYLAALVALLVLTSCGAAPAARNETPTASPTQVSVSKPPPDSVLQFLITSAATDFHTQMKSKSVSFRNVRFGHILTPGNGQQYMLCGEFHSAQQEAKDWTPFATIKTSGYEQWNGAQAEHFCGGPSVIWDNQDRLSELLQSRFDSLH